MKNREVKYSIITTVYSVLDVVILIPSIIYKIYGVDKVVVKLVIATVYSIINKLYNQRKKGYTISFYVAELIEWCRCTDSNGLSVIVLGVPVSFSYSKKALDQGDFTRDFFMDIPPQIFC